MLEIKRMLRDVILDGTGTNAEISGWRVAGKTGTAQKWINGKYSNEKFISNFVGFFLEENPQLLSLIIIDEPKQPYHWGGQGAAIAFKRIMKRIINMDDSIFPPSNKKQKKHFGMHATLNGNNIKYDLKELEDIPIQLSVNAEPYKEVKIPELRGLSMRKAMQTLYSMGINPDMIGSGKVSWQSPAPGTLVQIGDICKVGLN